MPVVDYSKTVIYKIQHKSKDELLYVGSTTHFGNRKVQHKSKCYNTNNKIYNNKLYTTIRQNGGWDAFNMVIIKEFPCNNKQEALTEEDRVMRQMLSSLNMLRAYVSKEDALERDRKSKQKNYEQNKEIIKAKVKEYCKKNVDKIKEYKKEYREKNLDKIKEQIKEYNEKNLDKIKEYKKEHYKQNKEHIKEYQKVYNELNREKIKERAKEYQHQNKDKINEQRKKYRQQNIEKIKERAKEYYEKNKEKLKEKNKEQIHCECGCILIKNGLPRHKRSKKHQEYINQQTDQ